VEVNTISNKVEEKKYKICLDGGMMELNDREESMVPKTPCLEGVLTDEEEEGTKLVTPRTKTCCNDASNTLREIGSTQ
jgi:hypothetical protein